jgi:predicted ATPase
MTTVHLRSITLERPEMLPESFPYTVPVIRTLETLTFPTPVTFFVGENGSGKSTLLETIACAAHLPTIGADQTGQDASLADIRRLSQHLRWSWTKRTRRGFFMRSEDFFGYARHIARTRAELKADLEGLAEEYAGRSRAARLLASLPYARELGALENSYGDGLDAQSHGESFFKLFRARFVPDGLYLMDEPEAPLSPSRQLSLLALIGEMVRQNAQFIIATHSPIVLAYPGATIYRFDDGRIAPTAYDDLEHVALTRAFLNNPQSYLRHLLDAE